MCVSYFFFGFKFVKCPWDTVSSEHVPVNNGSLTTKGRQMTTMLSFIWSFVVFYLSLDLANSKTSTTRSFAACSQEEIWVQRSASCCSVCPPGTGAVAPCYVTIDSDTATSSTVANVEISTKNSNTDPRDLLHIGQCAPCTPGLTFSSVYSHEQPCQLCSTCPKNARVLSTCNSTHDVVCVCEDGFYLSERTGQCDLCDLCPVGWGASTVCGHTVGNTACRMCQNGTFSDVLSASAPCRTCTECSDGQRLLQTCTSTQDTICLGKYMDIPPMYRFNHKVTDLDLSWDAEDREEDFLDQNDGRNVSDDNTGEIDVIPLYCAALGAVVVGLLAYVGLVHYRRMRDKRLAREPHEDVEYSKASCADSGIFLDPDLHLHQNRYVPVIVTGSTRLRDLPQSKRKELEKMFLAGSKGADWKSLARELGYNSGKIASFESHSCRDPAAPYRHVVHDWSRLEGATVAAFLRALRNAGRQDVVKFLQAECVELLQPLTGILPHNVV